MKNNKAQSLSFDAITAVGLFVVILIIAVLYYYNLNQAGIQDTLSQEAVIISQNLLSQNQGTSAVTDLGVLDEAKIISLIERLLNADNSTERNKEYQKIKIELGIRDDFCIYIEDEDGNLVMLQVNDGVNLVQTPAVFGSDRAYINTTTSQSSFVICDFPEEQP